MRLPVHEVEARNQDSDSVGVQNTHLPRQVDVRREMDRRASLSPVDLSQCRLIQTHDAIGTGAEIPVPSSRQQDLEVRYGNCRPAD